MVLEVSELVKKAVLIFDWNSPSYKVLHSGSCEAKYILCFNDSADTSTHKSEAITPKAMKPMTFFLYYDVVFPQFFFGIWGHHFLLVDYPLLPLCEVYLLNPFNFLLKYGQIYK